MAGMVRPTEGQARPASIEAMSRILVVADAPWVRNGVHAALSDPGMELIDHDDPATAASRALAEEADAVVVDLQIDAMGGMAVTRAIREVEPTEGAIPVVLLLDRAADAFLARRAGADRWVKKPFDPPELRDAVRAVTSGTP